MFFNLIAMFEDAAETPGLSIGALIGLAIGGSVVLAGIIFGIVLKARESSQRSKKAQAKRAKKQPKVEEAPAPVVVVEEKHYDYTNLSEEEKELIRNHRDGVK